MKKWEKPKIQNLKMEQTNLCGRIIGQQVRVYCPRGDFSITVEANDLSKYNYCPKCNAILEIDCTCVS